MISETSKKWLDAGIVLAKDPNAKVVCPECTEGTLEVQEVRSDLDPTVVERIMKCPVCGKFNALRLRRPQ